MSPAYLRVARPGAVVATAAVRRNPRGHTWDSSLGDTFGSPALRDALEFAVPVTPDGTRLDDTRGDLDGLPVDTTRTIPDDDVPDDPGDGPLPTVQRRRRRSDLRERRAVASDSCDPSSSTWSSPTTRSTWRRPPRC